MAIAILKIELNEHSIKAVELLIDKYQIIGNEIACILVQSLPCRQSLNTIIKYLPIDNICGEIYDCLNQYHTQGIDIYKELS